ncbi:MAG: ROK family protein [Caldilineaceae bacterium]|nr:ROK family protein [Caldilineaceae bacterium]
MSLPRAVIRHVLSTPMSLADLQQATQVSLPTLRRAVQDLTEARWIRVVGQAEANGGRPAMLFGVDTTRFLLVGVHLQLPGMRLIAADLAGAVLDEIKLFDQVVPTPHEAVQAVADYVFHLRDMFPDRVILGVGIASPGFTDLSSGDIISIGRVPTWENFPVCRRLQAMVELPVRIANDVDCMAFAEFLHSSEPLDKNLAYVGYDEGVKVSLFLKGELYKGSLGNAGLIASHLLHAGDRPGLQDVHSLLTVIGVNQRFVQSVAALDVQAPYAEILSTSNPRARFRLILNGDDAAMPLCRALVTDLNAALAAAVANVIHIVQPDIVVIGGLLSAMPAARFAELEADIQAHLPALIGHNAIIRQGKLASQNGAAKGAILHFLQAYLGDPTVELDGVARG